MSTIEERIEQAFTTLSDHVTKAEESKGQAKPVATLAATIGRVVGTMTSQEEEAAKAIAVALGDEGLGLLVTSVASLRALHEALGGKSEETDREAGDTAANALRAVVTAHLMDEEAEAKATALLGRWDASKPGKVKAGGKSGTSDPKRTAPLGFDVRISCQEQGCGWSASCSKDDLNSIRRQGQVHARDKHQDLTIAKGHENFKMLTDALVKVMHEGSESVDGGRFVVTHAQG